eukprot:TRINITY_DN42870_c0_g1_i1.p1 TRINITY_DN42870_c0_g1~~TRINITY_DN42870_c0_g1_i1.p1  ORF type:complete len:706 (+),score=107.31 TRINITY_DN42870_c0_g1_i1:33-2120(+)
MEKETSETSKTVDTRQRLLNLVPTPTWEVGRSNAWSADYSLAPAAENWPRQVREADRTRPALTVGFVGATSAGKSWMVSKLQSDGALQPQALEHSAAAEEDFLQSVTSDINLYADPVDHIYYVDFEGTYGTEPRELSLQEVSKEVQRCVDEAAWTARRSQVLREAFQPSVACLMCDVVVFLTRERLVCRRALEECENFALAANSRVANALPPALILVQNCCRPLEGIFDSAKCTDAFRKAHLRGGTVQKSADSKSGMLQWAEYFRSIDCFCIPDEFAVCKRTAFDGEEMSNRVVAELKETIRRRLSEGMPARLEHSLCLSQLQWFAALSTLCSIINDQETVAMSAISIHAGAIVGGVSELRSELLQLMHPHASEAKLDKPVNAEEVKHKLVAAVELVARFAVRHEIAPEEIQQLARYLVALFPCGAVAPPAVERSDGENLPVPCGQCQLFHKGLHRSGTLVRTLDAGWLQTFSEWLQGGVTYAWPGEYACHPSVADLCDAGKVNDSISLQVEEYKVERCLEGLSQTVGVPWLVKAYRSFAPTGIPIRLDESRLCIMCTAGGSNTGDRWSWMGQPAQYLPVCGRCHTMMQANSAHISSDGSTLLVDAQAQAAKPGCGSCGKSVVVADHRLQPCRCLVCRQCSERVAKTRNPLCPLCESPVRWLVDDRAILASGWRAAPRLGSGARRAACGFCVASK